MSGTPIHDPATGYIARDGAYVIRNDRTGMIVEVSDRSSINGIAFWRNGKDGVATWETVGAKTGAKVEEKFAGKAARATEGAKITQASEPTIKAEGAISTIVEKARARQMAMLEEDIGFNISPMEWDKHPMIGRTETFVSDRKGIIHYFGDISGKTEITVSQSIVSKIEKDIGLSPGTLKDGFKIRQITGIKKLQPASPMQGNEYFLGSGKHLPGGAPELIIRPIPSTDNDFVSTILKVKVE